MLRGLTITLTIRYQISSHVTVEFNLKNYYDESQIGTEKGCYGCYGSLYSPVGTRAELYDF